jgi:hypothetical protein
MLLSLRCFDHHVSGTGWTRTLLIVAAQLLLSQHGTVLGTFQLQHQHMIQQIHHHDCNSAEFPTLDDVAEMAALSSLIYAFHKEDYGNDDIGNNVCDRINHQTINNTLSSTTGSTVPGSYERSSSRRRTQEAAHIGHNRNTDEVEVTNIFTDYNRTIPNGIQCEWYHHDWIDGTQIMIVSSVIKNYIAIVFAGTDDMTTSLTDADILLTPFGFSSTAVVNSTVYPIYNVTLDDPNVRVHSGFDSSIYNERNLFGEMIVRIEHIRYRIQQEQQQQVQNAMNIVSHDNSVDCSHLLRQRSGLTSSSSSPSSLLSAAPRFFTTGHSLGASNSILTAVGFVQYFEQVRNGTIIPPVVVSATRDMTSNSIGSMNENNKNDRYDTSQSLLPPVDHIMSINFGCPQTGNTAWRDYIHTNPVMQQRLSIYRLVLGWDIVPRLPTLLQHVGHTIQLSTTAGTNNTKKMNSAAYYHHIGDTTLQYAGVPFGWSATPFIWIPGALFSHFITAYVQFLSDLTDQAAEVLPNDDAWIHDFEHVVPIPYNDSDDNAAYLDDDYYIEPPVVSHKIV